MVIIRMSKSKCCCAAIAVSPFQARYPSPNVPLREDVVIHLVPDTTKQLIYIRIWWNDKMAHSAELPLEGFAVHF